MNFAPRRLLKNSRMPRCCQFSEDRKEPSAGRSRSATDKLGDTARAEKWRNPDGDMRQFFNSLLENPTRFTDVSMPAKEDIAAKIPAPAFEIS